MRDPQQKSFRLSLQDDAKLEEEGAVVRLRFEPSRTKIHGIRVGQEQLELKNGVVEFDASLLPREETGHSLRVDVTYENEPPTLRSAAAGHQDDTEDPETDWDLVEARWDRFWSDGFEPSIPAMFFTEMEERSNPPVITSAPPGFPIPPNTDRTVNGTSCGTLMGDLHFHLIRRVKSNGRCTEERFTNISDRDLSYVNEEMFYPLLQVYFGGYELPSDDADFDRIWTAFEAFSSGSMRYKDGDELRNVQPSSSYYFLFAEYALHMQKYDQENLGLWQRLAQVFVGTQHIFSYCYHPQRVVPRAAWYSWKQSREMAHENDFGQIRELYQGLAWEELEAAHTLNAIAAFPRDRRAFESVDDPEGDTEVVSVVPLRPRPRRARPAHNNVQMQIHDCIARASASTERPVAPEHLRPAHRIGHEFQVDEEKLLANLHSLSTTTEEAQDLTAESLNLESKPFVQQVCDIVTSS